MDLRLKVMVGKGAGQELAVAGPKFLVGRADDCQLRPRSDLISRHHCALLLEDGYAGVRDFGSKNGTLVNGERVLGERELKNGDRLTIGPLEFEVCLSTAIAKKKMPKVESVKEAAARTMQSAAASSEGGLSLDEWLTDDETSDATTRTQNIDDTRRFSLSETDKIDLGIIQPPEEPRGAKAHGPEKSAGPHDKRQPGKLPTAPPSSTKDSGQAAADALSKFFKRR